MLKRFRMPLFVNPEWMRSSQFGQSYARHFHDYVFTYYGLL